MRAPCRGAHSRPACDCCPSDGGDGAPKGANPNGTRFGEARGASRRASRGDLTAPGRAFAVSVPLPVRTKSKLRFAFGIDLTVVSQLLAGPRNGHGRSPDAARVPALHAGPRAPRPVPPHDAS